MSNELQEKAFRIMAEWMELDDGTYVEDMTSAIDDGNVVIETRESYDHFIHQIFAPAEGGDGVATIYVWESNLPRGEIVFIVSFFDGEASVVYQDGKIVRA